MDIFVLPASLRKESLNRKLSLHVKEILENLGHTADMGDLHDFTVPLYDGDIETSEGIPDNAHALSGRIKNSSASIFISPEYNFSVPGVFKNLIDWTSRIRPMPFENEYFLLASASPSLSGGSKGVQVLRVSLEHCGAFVYPKMYSLPRANNALQNGKLEDDAAYQRLEGLISDFLAFVR